MKNCLISSILECPSLRVVLKNDVLRKQGTRQGTYKYLGIINGRDSWKKDDQVIWYYPKYKDWHIGSLNSIGTDRRGIASRGDSKDTKIFNVPKYKWKYFSRGDWKNIKSGDISVTCVKGKISRNIIWSRNTLLFLSKDLVTYLIILPMWRLYGTFKRYLLKILQ